MAMPLPSAGGPPAFAACASGREPTAIATCRATAPPSSLISAQGSAAGPAVDAAHPGFQRSGQARGRTRLLRPTRDGAIAETAVRTRKTPAFHGGHGVLRALLRDMDLNAPAARRPTSRSPAAAARSQGRVLGRRGAEQLADRGCTGGVSAMSKDFTDKVALVTGAGSGIGQEAARLFASRGAHVFC